MTTDRNWHVYCVMFQLPKRLIMHFKAPYRLFGFSVFMYISFTNSFAAPELENHAVEVSKARKIFEQAKAYHDGQGVPQDLLQAYLMYTTAAKLGDVHAKVNLGYMSFMGEGKEQNYYEARNWYTQAAAAGDADAIATLAMMDRHELGVVTEDMAEILAPISRLQQTDVDSDDIQVLDFDSTIIKFDDTEVQSTTTQINDSDDLAQESITPIVFPRKNDPIKSEDVILDAELIQYEARALDLSADTAQPAVPSNSHTTSALEALFLSAYSHHPALNSLREQTNASREAIVEAHGSYLPQVSLNGSIFKTDRDGELQTGVDFNQNTTPQSVSLNLTQTLFNGGRRKLAKRNAFYVAEASQANFMDSSMQIAAEVIQDYMSLYRAQNEVNVLSETVTTLQELEEIVIARRKIGDATTTDVSQANSQLISARAQLSASKADIANMQSILLSKTGQSVEVATLPIEATKSIPNNLKDLQQLARDGSAALKASEFTMLSREVTLKSEKRKGYPTVSLEANASSRRDTSPTILSDDDLNIGVRVSMPIYTGGIGASQTRQAQSLYNAARFDYEDVGRLIDLQVMRFWSQLQSNRGVIEGQRASVAANTETLTSVSERQKAGISSSQDVLDAARNKLEADLALASAEHEQYTIRLLLRLLIGELGTHEFE